MTKEELLQRVLDQIRKDILLKETEALELLLESIPEENLKAYLPMEGD